MLVLHILLRVFIVTGSLRAASGFRLHFYNSFSEMREYVTRQNAGARAQYVAASPFRSRRDGGYY